MKSALPFFAGLLLGLCGCAETRDTIVQDTKTSPIGRLVSGDIEAGEYFQAVEEANIESREREERERNYSDSTKAYNTETGRYEYVPRDTQQKWNDEKQRWEFTPVKKRD